MKSDREVMEILEAFDVTGCAHSAGRLAGVDPKTVRAYVRARDEGRPVTGPRERVKLVDGFAEKIEELVDKANGSIRADKVHERIVAMGFTGAERTTRRAVRAAKERWRAGTSGRFGRGSASRGCGSSSTGVRGRRSPARTAGCGARCCSVRGWRGPGSGS